MEFVFFVGVFVIFCVVVCVVGSLFYWFFDLNDDKGSRIAATAIALILFIDLMFSIVLSGFIFSPESYGYTKIQTESEASIK